MSTIPNTLSQYGLGEKEIEDRLEAGWDHIFGETSPHRFYFPTADGMGHMVDTGNHDVRTEGMSYGMMMAVMMDRKDIFDRLWRWAWTHMLMREGAHRGFFAWSCDPSGAKNSHGPAPDGENFFAMALWFASRRWGDGPAPLDYRNQAQAILRAAIHRDQGGMGPSMWHRGNHLIKFVPDLDFSDPSYHTPHFSQFFATFADEGDRPFWEKATKASRAYIRASCHPLTGLAPEYANYDGSPNFFNDHGDFFSDSYRVAANIGLDHLWNGPQDEYRGIMDRLLRFFRPLDPKDYRIYTIAGEPKETPALHPVGLVATNALGAVAAEDTSLKDWAIRLFLETEMRSGDRRYYDNCLYFFTLLGLAGRYHPW